MPDLTAQLLPRLKDHRLPELALPAEFVQPNYQGLSILNTPNSICKLLGAPLKNQTPALSPSLKKAFSPFCLGCGVVWMLAVAASIQPRKGKHTK